MLRSRKRGCYLSPVKRTEEKSVMDNSAKKQKMLARKLTRYGIVGPDANMWTGETKMHCDGVHIKGLGNGDNAEEISMCGVALENIVWHCSDSDARSTFALGCGVLFNLGADANTCALVQGNMSHGTPMLSPDGDANRGSPRVGAVILNKVICKERRKAIRVLADLNARPERRGMNPFTGDYVTLGVSPPSPPTEGLLPPRPPAAAV